VIDAAGLRIQVARQLRFLPPRAFAVALRRVVGGETPDLRRPRSFTELLAAKNLGPQDPLVHLTTDKYAVREHVAGRVGPQYLIPLRQVVDRPEALDDAALAGPCVVKATHGCEMTLLLPRGTRDRAPVEAAVRRWLATDFSTVWKESAYRGLPRRAVVEEYIGDASGPPPDVKFYVFHGEVGMIQVDGDRFGERTSNLVDPRWRELRVEHRYRPAPVLPEPPEHLAEMTEVARALGKDFPFARVDLYEARGRVWFGEITHYPGGGIATYGPPAFDRAVGRLWRTGEPLGEEFLVRR
jgi:hypothetical protein